MSEHLKEAATLLFACAEELTDITKTANILSSAAGGLKNALVKGWQGQGRLGQGMTVATTGLQAPEVLSEQDPTGQNRSRGERAAGLAGFVGGGLIGDTVGRGMGSNVAKQLDPKDAYKAQAFNALDKTIPMPTKKVSDNIVKQKASEALQRMQMTPLQRAGEGVRTDLVKGTKQLAMANMSTGARWANRGLRALPMAGAIGMSLLGSELGSKLLRKPFQWFGKQNQNPGVVGQFNNPETEQSTVTLSNNN